MSKILWSMNISIITNISQWHTVTRSVRVLRKNAPAQNREYSIDTHFISRYMVHVNQHDLQRFSDKLNGIPQWNPLLHFLNHRSRLSHNAHIIRKIFNMTILNHRRRNLCRLIRVPQARQGRRSYGWSWDRVIFGLCSNKPGYPHNHAYTPTNLWP